jgi:hypothetical protein
LCHDRGTYQRLLLCASALSSLRIFINVSNVTIFVMARIQITPALQAGEIQKVMGQKC